VRACTAEIMRAITALVEQLRGEKAPRPYDMKYDGNPGKGKIGVRRPDPPPPTRHSSVESAAVCPLRRSVHAKVPLTPENVA